MHNSNDTTHTRIMDGSNISTTNGTSGYLAEMDKLARSLSIGYLLILCLISVPFNLLVITLYLKYKDLHRSVLYLRTRHLFLIMFALQLSNEGFSVKERYWILIGICPPVAVKPLWGHFFHGLMVWPLVWGNHTTNTQNIVCQTTKGSSI